MKKLAILIAAITIAALAATDWQLQSYQRDILRCLVSENAELHQAITQSELLASGREQTISNLESRLMALTNHPAGEIRSSNG